MGEKELGERKHKTALAFHGSLSSALKAIFTDPACRGLVASVLCSGPSCSPPVGFLAVGIDLAALWSWPVFVSGVARSISLHRSFLQPQDHGGPFLLLPPLKSLAGDIGGMRPCREQPHGLFWEETKRARWGGRGH